MKTIKDKIFEYEKIWESKITESSESRFWKAVALSYIGQDVELETKQIFITQISFYPKLIETLISVLGDIGNNIRINITFFSTLLPRHYWNFPIAIKSYGNKDLKTYSKAMTFLDDYRKEICKCTTSTNQNIKIDIKRVLFLAEDKSVADYGDTDLFLKSDFETDFKYYCIGNNNQYQDGKVKWSDLALHKDKRGRSLIKQKEYLLDGNVDNLDLENDIYKTNRKDEFIYLLPYKRSEIYDTTVGEFYVEQLHTNSAENARYIIIGTNIKNDGADYTEQQKQKGYYLKKQLPDLSPNLSYIEITYKDNVGKEEVLQYILDTYMDIKQEIVRLKIVRANDEPQLLREIKEIVSKSAPIKLAKKGRNTKSSYCKYIQREIKRYINGEVNSDKVKEKGEHILSNINSLSIDKLQEIYNLLINNPVSNNIIAIVYEKLPH